MEEMKERKKMSSKHPDAEKLIHSFALAKKIPEEEIRKEIQNAIDMEISCSTGPALALWNMIQKEGDKPTPEEFITFLLKNID